jgi:hypothetical protein
MEMQRDSNENAVGEAMEMHERRSGVGTGHGEGSKRTQFKPGNPGGPGRGGKKLSEEVQDQLTVMRHVVSTPPTADQTYQQRAYRQWLKANLSRFMTKLVNLEIAASRRRRR